MSSKNLEANSQRKLIGVYPFKCQIYQSSKVETKCAKTIFVSALGQRMQKITMFSAV